MGTFGITKPKIIFLPRFTSLRQTWKIMRDLMSRKKPEYEYLAYRCLLESEEIISTFQNVHIVSDENREVIIEGLDRKFRENFDEIFLILQRKYFEYEGSYTDKLIRALEFIALLDLAHTLGIRRGKIFSPVKELPLFCKEVVIDEEKIKDILNTLKLTKKTGRALKLLHAAATIAKYSAVFPESNPILQEHEKHVQEYMEEIWPELINGPYDEKTENQLVWAYKIYCSVFGHSQKLLMELEEFISQCLTEDLSVFREETVSLIKNRNYPEALNKLQSTFWLSTPDITKKLAKLKKELVTGARETYIKRIKNEDDLYQRHEMAESAVATLDGFIQHDDPLIKLKKDLEQLIEQLDTFIANGKRYQEEGDCLEALNHFYRAQAIWHHPEALIGAKSLEEKVNTYQQLVEEAEKETDTSLKWLIAQKALRICPKGVEATKIANETEEKLILVGNQLTFAINGRTVCWYTQTQLTMARENADISIQCKSMSGADKAIVIGIEDDLVWVEDKGSSNGVYIISQVGDKRIGEATYELIPPGKKFEIENTEGELLVGGIVRLLYRKHNKCLLLKLGTPYPPQKLWPDSDLTMDKVWPDYQEACEVFHILSPVGINLGLFLDKLGKELHFPATIRWFRGKYMVQTREEPIEINGVEFDKVPLLKGLIYACNGKTLKALNSSS